MKKRLLSLLLCMVLLIGLMPAEALTFSAASFETVIDDKTQTVVRKSIDSIIPLQVNQ